MGEERKVSSNEKTLLNCMNEELNKMPRAIRQDYKWLEDFITNDTKSAAFIRLVLHDDTYTVPSANDKNYIFSATRSRHSVITYLMGMMIFSLKYRGKPLINYYCDLFKFDKEQLMQIWMAIALYHDKGYYSTWITKPEIAINSDKMTKYHLLDDKYDVKKGKGKEEENEIRKLSQINDFMTKCPLAFAHTYSQILAYDKYAREFHRANRDREQVDHGILGGVLTFDNLVRQKLKGNAILDWISIKLVCLTIAQHNIFKSDSSKRDEQYTGKLKYLRHNSDFKVGFQAPLLLLLSLVDTVECVKRFSKESNTNNYLETITILSKIRAIIRDDVLILDFSELKEALLKKDNKKLVNKLFEHMDLIENIGKWTIWKSKRQDNRIMITL